MRTKSLRGTPLLVSLLLLLGTAVPARAIDWEKIVVNGYTSFEFERQIEPENEGAGDPNGSFDADEFDVVLNFQVSDKIRAAADLTWEHGAASEDDRGNVAMEYGFVEYTVSDLLKVRVGKMFTPFGVFNQIHTAKPAFLSVKEPASTNKPERIVGAAARFFPRWGAGIALQGDGTTASGRQFDYDVLIANGDPEFGEIACTDDTPEPCTNPFETDDDKTKSITGRFRFAATESLRIGASLYWDDASVGDPARVASSGVELEWNRGQVEVLAEAVFGDFDGPGGGRRQVGWFVQPAYRFENGLTPYLRAEWIDPDTDASADEGETILLGVNYELWTWFMIKAEIDHFEGARDSSLGAFPGRDYNEIKAAVVLGF